MNSEEVKYEVESGPDEQYYQRFTEPGALIADIVNNWDADPQQAAWWIIRGAFERLQEKAYTRLVRNGIAPSQADEIVANSNDCVRNSIAKQWYEKGQTNSYYLGRTLKFLFWCITHHTPKFFTERDKERIKVIEKAVEERIELVEKDRIRDWGKDERVPEVTMALHDCIDELSPTNLAVVELLMDNRSKTEVAKILNRSISDVSKAAKRSLPLLKQCLQRKGFFGL